MTLIPEMRRGRERGAGVVDGHSALPSGPPPKVRGPNGNARFGSNGCVPERLVLAQPTVQPKTAFSRFPPVHRAELKGQQRVDSGPLVLKDSPLTVRQAEASAGSGLHDGSDASAGPIFEADLPSELYAYRPGRNAQHVNPVDDHSASIASAFAGSLDRQPGGFMSEVVLYTIDDLPRPPAAPAMALWLASLPPWALSAALGRRSC
jgi:hypothetical protein